RRLEGFEKEAVDDGDRHPAAHPPFQPRRGAVEIAEKFELPAVEPGVDIEAAFAAADEQRDGGMAGAAPARETLLLRNLLDDRAAVKIERRVDAAGRLSGKSGDQDRDHHQPPRA